MKDDIFFDEAGIQSICGSLQGMADEIGSTTGNLSVARELMDAMPSLVCGFAFGALNPVFSIVAVVRRGLQAGTVIYALVCANRQIRNLEDNIRELINRIQKAADQLMNAEMRLVSHFTSNGATDDPFDLNGQNGGDQGLTKQRIGQSTQNDIDPRYYDSYRDIIEKNTGKRLNDQELQNYLDTMNSRGCGYVASINAIIAAYRDRPADFERDFGIPLYRDGDYNYDQILVDFYSITNQGRGLNSANNTYAVAFKEYFEAKGLPAPSVTVNDSILTTDRYQQMISSGEAKPGQVFLSAGRPLYIRNADGTPSVYFGEDAGHAMTIIGTDGDCFIVSTWGNGESYRINPADYQDSGYLRYVQVDIS